jgi:hypothetical protein
MEVIVISVSVLISSPMAVLIDHVVCRDMGGKTNGLGGGAEQDISLEAVSKPICSS